MCVRAQPDSTQSRMLCFGLFLWKAALELNAPAEPAVSAAEDDFRPVVGDPPYRVAIDAGHGGSDPGARGVVEEKQVTAATAAALLQWLEQDSNYAKSGAAFGGGAF